MQGQGWKAAGILKAVKSLRDAQNIMDTNGLVDPFSCLTLIDWSYMRVSTAVRRQCSVNRWQLSFFQNWWTRNYCLLSRWTKPNLARENSTRGDRYSTHDPQFVTFKLNLTRKFDVNLIETPMYDPILSLQP